MDTQYDADVIVIGSGALGSNAAYELAKKGRSVIMLEAGSRIPRWKIVENYRTSPRKHNFNDPYPNQPWAHTTEEPDYIENTGSFKFLPGMLKLVGGTTWHWAAACWRYLPNDMKLKTLYGVGRDWPIDYDTLEPYYQRAEEALGVSGNDQEDQSGQGGKAWPPRSKPYPLPPEGTTFMTQRINERLAPEGYHYIHEPNGRASKPYEGRPACCGNNNCMPVCPIGAMYSGDVHATQAERAGVKLITEATAYKLEKGPKGKIVAVHYKKPTGEDVRITARYFVVAAHGLETPKLLLISEVANSSDQVGRNLMDHTGIGLTMIAKDPVWPGRGAVQQGGIFNWRDGDFRKNHSAVKHAMTNMVPNPAVTERLLKQGVIGPELDERIRHDASRWVDVSTVFEMLPHANNRITPGDKKDALGIPMLRVNYDVDDYAAAGKVIAKQDFAKFAKLLDAEIVEDETGWQNRDHIMGTVIMGSDPKDSVVDGDCRTHDHDNLFLATTGVIPASGVINPTLTGVALSIRIADTINKEI
ncbi:choline dehydrogenase-like flavoprotein [Luteibacter rhizovicinus]|uniref:Choline dehydrogenase-like flavoprotein n=1 Tax=Luteibacter rhizovicinus TaxID=242606 RepID=A0A4R3YL03_9GAMM|nr:GMC family oxidoreductase [Luteibacter rhizovicinus]TCV92088.1 choline dehydrogenase-like flavoprotein [Luteibacter rhizovicinus]